jgi:uncharacterized protein (TIGR03435 family)
MTLKSLITLAYGVDRPYIQGGPNWLDEQYYDIEAKVSGDSELTFQQMKPLLQHLFEERFRLKAHREQKIVPGYVLVVATGGPKLQPSNDGEVPHSVHIPYLLQAWHFGTADIATMLVGPVRGPIIDNTGLTSTYDFKLSYRIVNDPNTSVPDLFTAVQEQLGLKLLPEKVPVDTLVIDHVEEKPTEN